MIINTILYMVTFKPFDIQALGILAVIVVLLVVSAFNSAAETAFFSLSPANLDEIKSKSEDDAKSQSVIRLLKNPEKLLATVLLSNDLCNIAVAVLSAIFMTMMVDFGSSVVLEFVIQTVVITFVILLFAEIMPKLYASQNAMRVVRFSAKPLTIMDKLLSPLSLCLVKSTSFVQKKMKNRRESHIGRRTVAGTQSDRPYRRRR
mgnify:CR=1 FL=1